VPSGSSADEAEGSSCGHERGRERSAPALSDRRRSIPRPGGVAKAVGVVRKVHQWRPLEPSVRAVVARKQTGNSREEVGERLRVSQACCGRSVPHELEAGRPPRDVLVVGAGPVDEGGVLDVDAEQVELPYHRRPAKFLGDSIGILPLYWSRLEDGSPTQLELALTPIPARDDAVHEDPGVSHEIASFS